MLRWSNNLPHQSKIIFCVFRKHNRRDEGREDGSESNDDKVGLLTSAIMEEELEDNLPV